MFYLITFHESDGNDCTVYDAIVEAGSESAALEALAKTVETGMAEAGALFESDGSEFGYYFNCPEDCESLNDNSGEPCGLHSGGVTLRDVEVFLDRSAAEAATSRFHSRYEV